MAVGLLAAKIDTSTICMRSNNITGRAGEAFEEDAVGEVGTLGSTVPGRDRLTFPPQ